MDFVRFRNARIFFGLALVAALCASGAALGQSMATTPSAVNETQGATTGLGSSHRFPSQAAAQKHCPSDTVVWSSRAKLAYVLPSSPHYGKGRGFYACKEEADDAGFQQASQ